MNNLIYDNYDNNDEYIKIVDSIRVSINLYIEDLILEMSKHQLPPFNSKEAQKLKDSIYDNLNKFLHNERKK
jgi:hypothetical protein